MVLSSSFVLMYNMWCIMIYYITIDVQYLMTYLFGSPRNFFFLTTILFYSNACYNQLHKPKILMKQYIWYQYREICDTFILKYFIFKYFTNNSLIILEMNFSELFQRLIDFDFWCFTPHSTILQQYHGDQF